MNIPDLIRQIATQMGQTAGMSGQVLQSFVYAALGSAYQESGFNPQAVGDNGTSFGLFQLHEGGELGSNSAQWAYDPTNNITRALTEFISVWKTNPGVAQNPGEWAAMSQRPADQAGYASAVNVNVTHFSSGQIPIGPSVAGLTAPVGQAPAPQQTGSPWGSYGDYLASGFTTPPASTATDAAQTPANAAQTPAAPASAGTQNLPAAAPTTAAPATTGAVTGGPGIGTVPQGPVPEPEFVLAAKAHWDQQQHPQAPSIKVGDFPVALRLATLLKQGGHAALDEAEAFWHEYQPLLESGITPPLFEQMLGVLAPLSFAFHGRPPSLQEFTQLWDAKSGAMKPVDQITNYFRSLPDKHYPHVTAGDMVKAITSATPFARQFLGREPVKSEAAFFAHSGTSPLQHYQQMAPKRAGAQTDNAADMPSPTPAGQQRADAAQARQEQG